MRRLLTLVLVLTIGVLLGPACGGDSGRKPVAVLASAQTKTIDAKSSRVALKIETVDVSGAPKVLTGDGAFDYASRQGTMSLDAGTLGLPGVTGNVDVVLLSDVVYVQVPQGLLPGKPWLKIDLKALGQTSGLSLGGLEELGSNDPAANLRYLAGVGDDAKKVGEEKVRGVDTTRYHATIDLEKAKADASADVQATIDKTIKQLGKSTIPADVWVDGDDLVRRLRLTLDAVDEQATAVTLTSEFFDFGAKVDATAPPADQVSDFTKLLQSVGQAG